MDRFNEAKVKRKYFIIRRLLKSGFTKMEDGRQLYELSLADLERLYISMRCLKAKFVDIERVIG